MTLPSNYFLYATDLINTVLVGVGKARFELAPQTLDLQANNGSWQRGFASADQSIGDRVLRVRERSAAFGQRIRQMSATQRALPCVALTRACATTQAE
jgi:hypothetical protein